MAQPHHECCTLFRLVAGGKNCCNMSAPKRRPSLESTASIVIAGPAARTVTALPEPDIIESPSKFELFDAASVIVECPKHQKFAFRKLGSKKKLWYPTAVVSKIDGFEASIKSKLKQLLAHPDSETGYISFAPLEMMQYSRIQCPVVNQFVTRVIYTTKLTDELICCDEACALEWLAADEVSELFEIQFWGPEPLTLVPEKKDQMPAIMLQPFVELTVQDWSKLSPQDAAEVKTAGYEEGDVLRMYADYIQHIYPCSFMSFQSLISYLVKSGMIESEGKMQARISTVFFPEAEHRLCLTFSQFVAGLAVIDADGRHAGQKGNRSFIRCATCNDRMAYPVVDERFADITTLTKPIDAKCPKCVGPDHMVTNFSASLMSDGVICDFLEQSLADNVHMPIFEKELQYNLTNDRWFANQMIQWIYDHAFVNKIYTGPNDLPHVKRRKEPKACSLWSLQKEELVTMIVQLCELVKTLLVKEPRMTEFMGPCYIVGSLHGSLKDLLQMYTLFWKRSIPFEVGRYVFLGNMTGAHDQSLECLLYLFAVKCSAPGKVALIRGKAENRSQISHLSQQLKKQFPAEASKLTDSICSVFEVMPIACFINGWELCVSGGLPTSLKTVEDLNQVPLWVEETDSHPVTKAAVDPLVEDSALITRMKSLSIGSLVTGTTGASVSTYLNPGAVYHLSATQKQSVVVVSNEKMVKIEIAGGDVAIVNQ